MTVTNMIGRLTADVELRMTNTGKSIANFTLAVNRNYDRKTADFHRIVCFGKTAENVANYLHKGSQCAIVGEIQNNNYEDKNGVKHYGYQIVADRVEFLSTAKSNPADQLTDEDVPDFMRDDSVPF